MSKGVVAEVLGAVFLLAVISLLVRPNSLAPAFIKGFGDAMTEIVKFAVSG
jgi:hypothetical protein